MKATELLRNALKQPSWWVAFFFVALATLLIPLSESDTDTPLQSLNHWGNDHLVRWDAKLRPAPDNVVIIAVDQKSIEDPNMMEMAGTRWPWPRVIHGELLEQVLAKEKPAAIVFDVMFTEPEASDAQLVAALRKVPAYLPIAIAPDGNSFPLAKLPSIMGIKRSAHANPNASLPIQMPISFDLDVLKTGHINFPEDSDGIGRRYEVFRQHEGWSIPSMPTRIAEDQQWLIPKSNDIPLHWYGTPFQRLSYRDVYLSGQMANAPKIPSLKGKIVIIGAVAIGLGDLRATPMSGKMIGPEILATAISNLANQDWLHTLPSWITLTLTCLVILLIAWRYSNGTHPSLIGGALLLFSLIVIAFAWFAIHENYLWQPFAGLVLIWLYFFFCALFYFLYEKRKRQHIQQTFNRFLDPRVVKTLSDSSMLASSEIGQNVMLSVLFSDIRGFTTMSEKSSPAEIVYLLNKYFDNQVSCIYEEGGTLDKFIGDAIMAFWGAPVAHANHAELAVNAALSMAENLEKFKADMVGKADDFEIGIGINTGPAIVGFIGSSHRLDYTAIGDTVNLASRIEGQTKGIARVLVSEYTREACGNTFDFIEHGEFTVKGREQPVRLFEPRRKQQ